MSEKLSCPLCGSTNIETKQRIKTISEPFGGSKEVHLTENTCQDCGFDGDFLDHNDKVLEKAIETLRAVSASAILKDFSDHGYNISSIERALDLPQRTLAKWKSESSSPSAAGLTLLRFIRLFPWLIEVADRDFDFQEAQKICTSVVFNKAIRDFKFYDLLGQRNEKQSSGMIVRFVTNYNDAPELNITLSPNSAAYPKTSTGIVRL